jgi:beta-N-acetylhexosaminidase
MVGADEPAELRKLIELRAVSGVFISWRQAKGRNVAKLAASMHELQELQRAAGGAPLWIAADQEGGQVQRLSPPLKRLSSLSAVVGKHPYKAEREVAVRAFAREQGRALASVGVNVNFAPVVDINHSGKRYRDGRTRLFGRKISDDPETVAETARWYCEGLYAEGVRCTRKHFPGLGNVFADTHVREAMLTTPLDTLVKSDWVPFQSMSRPDWVMVGHMRAEAIDPDHPASASRGVIDKLRGLGHNGIVVTDDFSMGAIQRSKLGAGGAAVAALNAGVDVILVSYDTHQIYKVLHALVLAHLNGRLDMAMLEASDRRLAEARAHRPGYVAEVPVVQSALIPAVAMSPPAPEPEMPAGPAAGEPDPAPSRSAAVITAIPAPLPAVAPAQGATTGVPPAMGGQNGAEATQGLEPRKIRPARGSKARVAQVRFVAKRQVAAPQRRPFKLRAKR